MLGGGSVLGVSQATDGGELLLWLGRCCTARAELPAALRTARDNVGSEGTDSGLSAVRDGGVWQARLRMGGSGGLAIGKTGVEDSQPAGSSSAAGRWQTTTKRFGVNIGCW